MLNNRSMFQLIYMILTVLSLNSAAIPWNKVALVEVPAHQCLALNEDRSRLLCVSESENSDGAFTYFNEVRFRSGGAEKRSVLKLRDTTEVCRGPVESVAQFFGFETRDVDHDSRTDAVVLIRAGKLKRRGLADGVCSPEAIGTAIYEVSFRNTPEGLESYEPSYAVLQRLQSLAAIPAE